MNRTCVVAAATLGVFILVWFGIRALLDRGSPAVQRPKVIQSLSGRDSETARGDCPIQVPATASNLQFAVWSFNQATQVFVRFEAPVPDCLAHAGRLLDPWRTPNGGTGVQTDAADQAAPLCVVDPTEVDLAWFDLARFSGGVVFQARDPRGPLVWVDTNHGHFYYEARNQPCAQPPH